MGGGRPAMGVDRGSESSKLREAYPYSNASDPDCPRDARPHRHCGDWLRFVRKATITSSSSSSSTSATNSICASSSCNSSRSSRRITY
ncbi:hypothetical protein Emag_000876 [Eimeria magna]